MAGGKGRMQLTAVRVFVPFAAGYFLAYLLRVVNAVLAPDLTRDLGLDASDLGLLTSVFFLSFALFQVPLGMLLDRFGPRRTETALLLVAASGAVVFGLARSVEGLIVGRALLGLGTSACLMAALKAFVLWFDRARIPLINGWQMAAGGLGALTATVPVEAALHVTDWRGVFLGFGAALLVVAALIYTCVPEKPGAGPGSGFRDQARGVARVFTSRFFWRVAPLGVAAQASFIAVQSLWSGPWLRDVGGLGRGDVASHLLVIAAAMVAGFVSIGFLAERLGRLGIAPVRVAVTGVIAFMAVEGAIALEWTAAPGLLWAAYGFTGTIGIVFFAVLSQNFPAELAGRVVTGFNLMIFGFAFAIQWGTGAIIDQWPVTAAGGYAPAGYRAAFFVILGLQASALLWFACFRRRTSP